MQDEGAGAESACAVLLELDPLNHFARFEQYLRGKARLKDFTALIRNELPQETYLELAAWYHGVGLDSDAAKVLELAPPRAEALYWLAWLRRDTNLLVRAEAASPEFVFPFRQESIPVFEWAAKQRPAWQPSYFLALIRWHLGEPAQARQLLAACGDGLRFAPFYAARAQLAEDLLAERTGVIPSPGLRPPSPYRMGRGQGEGSSPRSDELPAEVVTDAAARDLQRAAQLDPAQWRYGAMLARLHLKRNDPAAALAVAADYAKRFPAKDTLALLWARSLLLTGQNKAAADLLSSLHVLPAEGVADARSLFREAHLLLAVARLQAGAFSDALRLIDHARQWPENLGAGQPYPADIDERLEDWLTAQCQFARKAPDAARQSLDKILSVPAHAKVQGTGDLIRALALKQSGHASEAERLLQDWQAQDPGSDLAKWGGELFGGHSAAMPTSLKDLDCRVLAGVARAGLQPEAMPDK